MVLNMERKAGYLQSVNDLLIQMVKDLEDTREMYWGFAYVRTMRNILTGNKKACIAPCFEGKAYYGKVDRMRLDEVETMMDALVRAGQLDVTYTKRGKLYCTIRALKVDGSQG